MGDCNIMGAFSSGGGGGGGALWSQAYQTTVTDANFDTGSDGIDFKKYIQMWLSFDGFDLGGSTNYKLESRFNNSSSAEYDARILQNSNMSTVIGGTDLNIFSAGGTMTEETAGNLFCSMINISGQPKYGYANGSWYLDGQDGGHFNRSSTWFQWTNTALLTRVAIVPDYGNASYVFSDATLTILHSDG